MGFKIVIIGSQDELVFREVVEELKDTQNHNYFIADNFDDLNAIVTKDFKGFFIFSLPQRSLSGWASYIQDKLDSFFKIYYYDHFFLTSFDEFMMLGFDFVIAGENRKLKLHNLLNFLKIYYWKKIPVSILKIKTHSIPILLRKVIFVFENYNPDITLEGIAQKLNVKKNDIRREIRNKLNMSFLDLKKTILNYYKQYFPHHANFL